MSGNYASLLVRSLLSHGTLQRAVGKSSTSMAAGFTSSSPSYQCISRSASTFLYPSGLMLPLMLSSSLPCSAPALSFFSPMRMFSSSTLPMRRSSSPSSNKSDEDNEHEEDEEADATSSLVSLVSGVPASVAVPEQYPYLPVIGVPRRPIFPGFGRYLEVRNKDLIRALEHRKKMGHPFFGAFLLKDEKDVGENAVVSMEKVYEVGTFVSIRDMRKTLAGTLQLYVQAHRRIKLERLDLSSNVPIGTVANVPDEPYDKQDQILKASCDAIISTAKDLIRISQLFREQIEFLQLSPSIFDDASFTADFGGSTSMAEGSQIQDVLNERNVPERVNKALVLLKREYVQAKLQQEIAKQVEENVHKGQRKYMLTEQLKSIKKELGIEKDDKESVADKFRERLKDLTVPETIMSVINEELNKLSHLEANSSEFNVTRNYLDWLTSIPWGVTSTENFDISAARKILEDDHFGMEDVKSRILEFIAVGALKGSVQGKILCLVGPPGVGKTSIAQSIAKALGRKYFRFSVGGMYDVSEIKGHRRTYVGAMPGKVIQCLKKTKTENPLILIDEVDKMGRGLHGDPAAALLELLDPEQNKSFMDHYLDVPIDLSKVLFVCTANMLDTISGPLLDRMEIIRLSGYITEEKIAIAKKYLIPQIKKNSGLEEAEVTMSNDAIESLIKSYCRESGVRRLNQHLEKVYRKAALNIVLQKEALLAEEKASQKMTESNDENTSSSSPSSPTPLLESVDSAAVAPSVNSASSEGNLADKSESKPNAATQSNKPSEPKSEKPSEPKSEKPAESQPDKPSDKPVVPYITPELRAKLKPVVVTVENLYDYVGNPVYPSDRMYDETPAGVVMGLAWTASGGSTLYFESIVTQPVDLESKPRLSVTGQLGDVMKESSQIAYTFAKGFMSQHYPTSTFLRHADIHLHVPEGAIKKDGPSAGCTMISSILSLAMSKPLRQNAAMTGEVSLTGKVLPVGGIKEKVIAAKRAGVNCIILPEANRRDYMELPDYIRDNVEIHFASHYNDVFAVVFPDEAENLGIHKKTSSKDSLPAA